MMVAKQNFNEVSEKQTEGAKKADRAMPKESGTGAPTKTRRIPSRDFGYEGAKVVFR